MLAADSGSIACKPLVSLAELLSWRMPSEDLSKFINVTKFDFATHELRFTKSRSYNEVKHHFRDSKSHDDQRKSLTRLAVCHDMKGGYLDDRYVQGTRNKYAYNFVHWHFIDDFIYFAHALVSIPPIGWTEACHRNGVRCLGTFITEFEDGAKTWSSIFELNSEELSKMIENLVDIAIYFQFDGYLMNVENPIESKYIDKLIDIFRRLRCRLKERIGTYAELMLYDSLTDQGKLDWQNSLTEANVRFAREACFDSLYLNYTWSVPREFDETERQIASVNSSNNQSSKLEKSSVYFGVDVFGRGSFGGGQIGTFRAVREAVNRGFSVAMFAPGWLYEAFEKNGSDVLTNLKLREKYERQKKCNSLASAKREATLSRFRQAAQRVIDLFKSIRPAETFQPTDSWLEEFYERDSFFWDTLFNEACSVQLKPICYPFSTRFDRGFGSFCYANGLKTDVGRELAKRGDVASRDDGWFNLAKQQILPSFSSRFSKAAEESGFSNSADFTFARSYRKVRNVGFNFHEKTVLNGSWSLALNCDLHQSPTSSAAAVGDKTILLADYPLFFLHLPLATLSGQVIVTYTAMSSDLTRVLTNSSGDVYEHESSVRILLSVGVSAESESESGKPICLKESKREKLEVPGALPWQRVTFELKEAACDASASLILRRLSLIIASDSNPSNSRRFKVLIDEFSIC